MSDEQSTKLSQTFIDPLNYLFAVMNDVNTEMTFRIKAATALMPYLHESLDKTENHNPEE